MAFFNLIARLGLDSTGYTIGLKQAENVATGFGERLQSKLGRKLDQMFGIGALIGGISAIASRLEELGKESQEVDKLAHKFNLARVEVYALKEAADKTGASIEELIKQGKPELTETSIFKTMRGNLAAEASGRGPGLIDKGAFLIGFAQKYIVELMKDPLYMGVNFDRKFSIRKLMIAEVVKAMDPSRYDWPSEETEIDRLIKEQKPALDKLAEARRKVYLESLDPAQKLVALERELAKFSACRARKRKPRKHNTQLSSHWTRSRASVVSQVARKGNCCRSKIASPAPPRNLLATPATSHERRRAIHASAAAHADFVQSADRHDVRVLSRRAEVHH